MAVEQIILPHLWRRYLSFLRALIGGACLGLILGARGFAFTLLPVLLASLTLLSLISAFWRRPETLQRGRISMALDLSTFLICAAVAGEVGFWIGALATLYLFLSLSSLHSWREVVFMTVLTLAFLFFFRPEGFERLQPLVLLMSAMGCVLAVQRKSILDRLSNSSRQAVYFRSESQRARESERERIAADFHDGPLQSFISFQMRLEVVRRMFERNYDAGIDELRQLREICETQVTELRTFIRNMRPVDVDAAGLASALRSVVAAFQKDSRITATFRADFEASHDDIEGSADLIQVVREALNNVQKHSNASRVAVSLSRENGSVRLFIEDDGTGFPFAGSFTLEELELLRLGPASIKRRVRSLGGDLAVDSRPGRGATLRIRVPL